MRRLRSRFAVCLLSASLVVGVGTPGCQQVAAALLKVLINVGVRLAATHVGKLIEEHFDRWFFDKNSSENQGGDVIATSEDALKGRYKGQMELTVEGSDGRRTTVTLNEPEMVRDSTASKWRLDQTTIRIARKRTEESIGR